MQLELNVLQAQQAQAQQRDIAQRNELMAIETRLRADEAARLITPQSPSTSPVTSGEVAAPAHASRRRVEIPDAALAASRARVEAISRKDR